MLPSLPHVVAVRVHRRVRVERANGVQPALREEPRVGLAARGLAAPSQSDWFGRNQVTRQQTMRSQTPLVNDPHPGAAFSLGLSTSTRNNVRRADSNSPRRSNCHCGLQLEPTPNTARSFLGLSLLIRWDRKSLMTGMLRKRTQSQSIGRCRDGPQAAASTCNKTWHQRSPCAPFR